MRKLQDSIRRLDARLGSVRGYTRRHLLALAGRVRSGEAEIDETTANLLAELFEGLGNEVHEAKQEAAANLRNTSRTIGHAIRRGFR